MMIDKEMLQMPVNRGATAEELSTISVGIWILFAVSVGFLIYWGPVTWNAWANGAAISRWITFSLFLFAVLCALIFFVEGLLLRNYVIRMEFLGNGLASFEMANGKKIGLRLSTLSSLPFIVYTARETELAGQRCLVLLPHLICVPETVEDFQSVKRRIRKIFSGTGHERIHSGRHSGTDHE